jgi:hypothetical protein
MDETGLIWGIVLIVVALALMSSGFEGAKESNNIFGGLLGIVIFVVGLSILLSLVPH